MKTIEVKIGESEVSFGFIGRKFRLQCVGEIRSRRRVAFKDAITNLPSDPLSVASTVSSAIDAHMTSVIIEDSDVNLWLQTPEGFFYTFAESLKVANPEVSTSRIDELHNMLETEQMAVLRKYWGRSLDGNRYDDIENAVKKYFHNAAVEWYGADGKAIAAFAEWLDAGKPGNTEVPVEATEVIPAEAVEVEAVKSDEQ
jgi:hypothetical protein